MTKKLQELFEELSLYKNDNIETSDFCEYGYEDSMFMLEKFDLNDWECLKNNWKNLSSTEQVFLANVMILWHIDEKIADIQMEICLEMMFSENEDLAFEAVPVIGTNSFVRLPRKTRIEMPCYLRNRKEVSYKLLNPKPSILHTAKAKAFLKKYFTKKVASRMRSIAETCGNYQKQAIINTLCVIASKIAKKETLELYNIIKNEFQNVETPEDGALLLIGNTNFIYATNGISGSFQLFWCEITSIYIETRDAYNKLEQGLSFSGLYNQFIPKSAENFEKLCKRLQQEFNLTEKLFYFSKTSEKGYKKRIWVQYQEPNAHIVEKLTFWEKTKLKKDIKTGFYLVHNGGWLDGDNPTYEKQTKQLIDWNTSIQELENLPNSYYAPIHEEQPQYKRMYFDRAIQIGSLVISDIYYDYPGYDNQELRKDIWFGGFDTTLHFEVNDEKAIILLKKEFTKYFGKPKKLQNTVYKNNPHYMLWDVKGILISINRNKEGGIDLKIKNTRTHPQLSRYKDLIELSDILEFPDKVLFFTQTLKESTYFYVLPDKSVFQNNMPEDTNDFIWRDDSNQTLGIYKKREHENYSFYSESMSGISVFPKSHIKRLEITAVKSWATDFCYIRLVTYNDEYYKIARYYGEKDYFNIFQRQLKKLCECPVVLMPEEEDVH